jgi:uncharacterized membrane protein YphA (DoxX/SURF4 family)
MEDFLDRLHARARGQPVFQRLAIISRIGLALAFVPTGMVKVMGERFTVLGVDSPVGLFFEAMYQSGIYWHFIGWAQVIAGILLLVPRTTTLGAVLFFPIVLNIFVITVGIGFKGTPFITGPMLLASLFLLCWDYDRLKAILWPAATGQAIVARAPVSRLEWTGYVVGTLSGLGVLGWTRGFVPFAIMRLLLVAGSIGAGIVLAAWVRTARQSRTHAPAS